MTSSFLIEPIEKDIIKTKRGSESTESQWFDNLNQGFPKWAITEIQGEAYAAKGPQNKNLKLALNILKLLMNRKKGLDIFICSFQRNLIWRVAMAFFISFKGALKIE